MPVGAIAGAVGSVAGGIASGKGAKKAAKIQAETAAKQTAALRAMYDENVGRMTPTYDRGEDAQRRIQTMLGLPGGDGSDPSAILAATPGYQFQLDQGLRATSANAYASGLGNSGAAYKALQDRGNGLAQQNYNQYVGQVSSVADRGVSAMNGLVSQGNYTTGAVNQQSQNAANAGSANAVFQGNNLANVIKGVAGSAGQAFGSSYSAGASPFAQASVAPTGGYTGPIDTNSFLSKYGVFNGG